MWQRFNCDHVYAVSYSGSTGTVCDLFILMYNVLGLYCESIHVAIQFAVVGIDRTCHRLSSTGRHGTNTTKFKHRTDLDNWKLQQTSNICLILRRFKKAKIAWVRQ